MSAVLTGLSLATGIAREATDGIPVVKQVLGVASRIVGLAEQIDKNRDDLRGLVDRAKKLDATLTAIVADRELDPEILRRLEGLSGVLNAIEKQFAAHTKQGRVRKTLRYILTVRKDIDRLKGEFDDRLKELELAANLDTNIIARGDLRFIGEFRNIRHCEIHLLRRITGPTGNEDGYTINCHLANCDGSNQVFVVRDTTVIPGLDESERRRMADHSRVLKQMSLIQNRHPVIARLYGWNVGSSCNRFVVLETGNIRPLGNALGGEGTAELSVVGKMVAKLVDVSCHLRKHGAAWNPTHFSCGDLYVDSNYEPTIGIDDDLATMVSTPEHYAGLVSFAIGFQLNKSTTSFRSQENQFPTSHLRSTMWCIEMFGDLIDAGYGTSSRENIVRRADIPSLIPLSQESWTYLHHALRRSGCMVPEWGFLLLRLAAGSRKCDGSIMGAWYIADRSGNGDVIDVYCIEADADVVYYRETHMEIPGSAVDEARQKLGIPFKGEREWENFLLQRSAAVGDTTTDSSGWTEFTPEWPLW